MEDSFDIRQATLNDNFEIAELSILSWRNSFNGLIHERTLDSLSIEKAVKALKNSLVPNQKKQRIFLANSKSNDQKKEILGFINFGYSFCKGLQNPGEIFAIHVSKNYQKFGVGRSLVNIAIDTLFHEGCKFVVAWVLDKNQPSRNFFERMGGEYFSSGFRTIGDINYNQSCFLWKNKLLDT